MIINTKNDFMSRITEKESCLPELVSVMNTSGLPLLFYGAGKYAELLYKTLKKYDLNISDVVVTHLKGDQSDFMGHKVKSISSVLDMFDRCNIFFAFQNSTANEIDQVERSLLASGKVADIFFYDAVHSNYYSEINLQYDFVRTHHKELEETYYKLADDLSRDIMISYLNQRISGDIRYLKPMYTADQYFPDIIKLKSYEIYIDCGAYNGDSIEAFVSHMGKKEYKIIAFEPDIANFTKLLEHRYKNLIAIQKGCFSEQTVLKFSATNDTGSLFTDSGNYEVEVDTIDNVLCGEEATYIKMDIEGAELEAINGAERTIEKYRPKLAISVYHKKEDLFSIPKRILEIKPDYKLYLRQHLQYSNDLVLYAI